MKKTYIILAIVAILAIGAVAGIPMYKEYMITKDPVNHIMYSFGQNYDDYRGNVSIDMTMAIDGEQVNALGVFDQVTNNPESYTKFINALLTKVHMKLDVNVDGKKGDLNSFNLEEDLSIEYGDNQLLGLDFNLVPYVIKAQSPQLSDKGFKLDINTLISHLSGMEVNLNDLDIDKYIKIIVEEDTLLKDLEANSKAYYDAIYSFLNGKVEKVGKGSVVVNQYGTEKTFETVDYKINMNILKIYELYANVLEVAKNDEKAKLFIKDRANKLVEAAKEDEFFKKYGAKSEDFNVVLEDIEKFDTDYETALDEVIKQFKAISNDPVFDQIKMESSFEFSIDKKHRLRKSIMTMTSGFTVMKQTALYNAYGDEVKSIDKFADKEMIDANELLLNPESEETLAVMQELMVNGISEIVSGEGIGEIISDIETEANNHLSAEEAQLLINQVKNFKQSLPLLLQMMGLGM